MALKPVGIEDDNTFPGRVGTALSDHARAAVSEALNGKADSGHTHSYDSLTDIPLSFTPDTHNHDDRYYTENEVDTALGKKMDKTSMKVIPRSEYDTLPSVDPTVFYFVTE